MPRLRPNPDPNGDPSRFKIILIVLAVVIAIAVLVVLLLASHKPDEFRVERSIVIAAPPEAIFPRVDSLRAWTDWSPWEQRDPAMKRDYSGPASGVGAVYGWDGNKDVGSGRMEIVESVPSSRIRIKLDFIRPFEGHNIAEFVFEPQAGGTRVVWSMHGPAPLLSKVMQVFMDMDAMIGRDFEAGLATLKSRAEAGTTLN